MLGGAGVKTFFLSKILDKVGKKQAPVTQYLDGADMKKLFSLKMINGAGVKKLL